MSHCRVKCYYFLPITPVKATDHSKTCNTPIVINFTNAPTILSIRRVRP